MRRASERRAQWALIILALFFALGGSAIAAKTFLITSTSQIKPSVLAKLKGKNGKNGLTGAEGHPGIAGPTGLAGSNGAAGAAGKNGHGRDERGHRVRPGPLAPGQPVPQAPRDRV